MQIAEVRTFGPAGGSALRAGSKVTAEVIPDPSASAILKWVLVMSQVILFSSIVSVAPVSQSGPGSRIVSERIAGPRVSAAALRAAQATRRSTRPTAALAALAATVVGVALLKSHNLRWEATAAERSLVLAGDELLPAVNQSTTRAITINAAAEDIWPWLVQLGQGRGGFYSYAWLENLIPNESIHNADFVVPEWQQIAVGDEVLLHPDVKLRVAVVEPDRALVLFGGIPMGKTAAPYEFSWAFVLLPQPDHTTRLVVRERYEYTRKWAALIVQPAQLVSSLMSPKMLRGIKTRAEHAAGKTAVERAALLATADGRLVADDAPAIAMPV